MAHSGPLHVTDAAAKMLLSLVERKGVEAKGLDRTTGEAAHAWLVEVAPDAKRDETSERRRYDDSQVYRVPHWHVEPAVYLIARPPERGAGKLVVVAVVLEGDQPPPRLPIARVVEAMRELDQLLDGASEEHGRVLDRYDPLWTLCSTAPWLALRYAERLWELCPARDEEARRILELASDDAHGLLDQAAQHMAEHEAAKAIAGVAHAEHQRRGRRGRPRDQYAGGHQHAAELRLAHAVGRLVRGIKVAGGR